MVQESEIQKTSDKIGGGLKSDFARGGEGLDIEIVLPSFVLGILCSPLIFLAHRYMYIVFSIKKPPVHIKPVT